MSRSRAGDQAAFREIYEQHAALLKRHMERKMPAKLRKRVSVSDLLQETFMTAFDKLPEFEGPHEGSMRRWLVAIAERKVQEAARHHLDTKKREADRELSRHERPVTQALLGREPTPSMHAMAAESNARLLAAMAELPRDYRMVLQYVHIEGMTMAAAGARMGRSGEAARKLYGRAVAKLTEALKRRGSGEDG